jgi:hypothetical protein
MVFQATPGHGAAPTLIGGSRKPMPRRRARRSHCQIVGSRRETVNSSAAERPPGAAQRRGFVAEAARILASKHRRNQEQMVSVCKDRKPLAPEETAIGLLPRIL